ncbi:MAG: phosphoglycerate dehydrogenase [Euryarchaeota archaeon]|nr:phosphoglycerate dehydrogenase [Euryarchaeota archaeon]
MYKLLVTDPLSEEGLEMLRKGGQVQVDVRPSIPHDELLTILADYDALVIRSGTKVTAEVIEAGKNLKVVGRAGVGVDNVDVKAATRRGILVMNTPSANIISAAEHTMAMMLSLARNIVWADASLKKGEWKRSKFTGIELNGKTLGIIGLGRVGGEVAKRAKSFQMKLIGYDPYIPQQAAVKMGVRLVSLEQLVEEADIITVHAALTPATHHLINRELISKMKPNALIINVARGELIDEDALYDALSGKKIAGAALDVYEREPPVGSKLLTLGNAVLTPHLGASTKEAQEKVSVEMAEAVKMFLLDKKITNAVNAPVRGMDPKVLPFISVAERLGAFAVQLTDAPVAKIQVTYSGDLANVDTRMLTVSALMGVLSNLSGEHPNIINAESIAREKGIQIVEVKSEGSERYVNMISVSLHSGEGEREVRGTAFPATEPRLLGIDGFDLDMPLDGDFLLSIHADVPGIVGRVGTLLGSKGVNIARMGLGREQKGGKALLLISVDNPVEANIVKEMRSIREFQEIRTVQLSNLDERDYLQI